MRAIFFDAGNTLVFPDHQRTLAPLLARGYRFGEDQLFAAERAARKYRDSLPTSELSSNTDKQYWVIYFRELLGMKAEESLIAELVELSRTSGNWKRVIPGTRDVLLRLKQRFQVAVISNSDGHMADLLRQVGLGDCFDSVTDSSIVGFQKPHPGIFQAALKQARVEAAESMYVGDIYSIDYLGATAVGMQAILMDLFGTYTNNGVPRVGSLEELEQVLTHQR
ncbi:MAG TPA: HAD family hydrolase [Terriglobales bacterium]|nr:HAD family hydrolase [Terriglobales bacterium]